MPGIFGLFDYTKEGPGVYKDAPKKAPIVVFFEILQRKFWSFIRINIMYFIFNIPAILLAFILSFIATHYIFPETFSIDIQEEFITRAYMSLMILGIFTTIPVITFGPAQAGFTYLIRNYSREEHAFIWSDFKEHALKNLKESIILSIISTVILVVLSFSIYFYINYDKSSILTTFASGFAIMAFLIFLMMHMYIYPMLVTFKLSIKQIIKNSLIFAIIKFFPNLLILIICVAIVLASFGFQPIIGIVLYPFFTLSLIGFITNFYVYPKLKKYIIEKVVTNENKDEQKEINDLKETNNYREIEKFDHIDKNEQ